jgi:hypothetical protein
LSINIKSGDNTLFVVHARSTIDKNGNPDYKQGESRVLTTKGLTLTGTTYPGDGSNSPINPDPTPPAKYSTMDSCYSGYTAQCSSYWWCDIPCNYNIACKVLLAAGCALISIWNYTKIYMICKIDLLDFQ